MRTMEMSLNPANMISHCQAHSVRSKIRRQTLVQNALQIA